MQEICLRQSHTTLQWRRSKQRLLQNEKPYRTTQLIALVNIWREATWKDYGRSESSQLVKDRRLQIAHPSQREWALVLPLKLYASWLVHGEQPLLTPASSSISPSRDTESPNPVESSYNLSNEETIRRLRAKGQPIRLFGETDKDRRLRLRALELIEEKGHDRQGGQNDFKKALEDVENNERELRNKNTKGKKKDDMDLGANSVLDLDLVKSDPDKLYPLIYYALKRTLKEWEEAMDERPGTSGLEISLLG